MKKEWHPSQGFTVLRKQLRDRILFGEVVQRPITQSDAIDIGLIVIVRTGLFTAAYAEWLGLPTEEKTLPKFYEFWAANASYSNILRCTHKI